VHLLAARPGVATDGSEAVDLRQTPGNIVFLSAADTELSSLARARRAIAEANPDFPSLRLANLLQLGHHMSVDLYLERTLSEAGLIVVRLLGGRSYWPYGVEQIAGLARSRSIALAFLPGDDKPDPDLEGFSTLDAEACRRLWQFLVHGGAANAENMLCFAASLLGRDVGWLEPRPLMRAGLYYPGVARASLGELRDIWMPDAPVAAIVFYRALAQAGNTGVIDGLIAALRAEGMNALPVFAAGLKDKVAAEIVHALLLDGKPDIVLNTTGFALSNPEGEKARTPFDDCPGPVLQAVFAGTTREQWEAGLNGLSARDIAMNVALPEVDGRVLARAVSFKGRSRRDDETECDIVVQESVPDRLTFTAKLAANWVRLRKTEAGDRRLAIVLANYPNRDGRLGNGVGLDTPAGTVKVLRALKQAGYDLENIPGDGNALIERIREGPTNAATDGRMVVESLSLDTYRAFFESLPADAREAVAARWGEPEADPFFIGDGFAISAFRLGNIAIGLQPARGYNIDPVETHHDPDLVPPHGYFAFYAWVRIVFRARAIVHMGKHGNLEWLPGKSLALSEACYPEAVLGPMPHLYPFIVNDPGEGAQAKRRAAAVIVDHLTPPLARAESHGIMRDLEALVDEYFEASGIDPRRLGVLAKEIVVLMSASGLDKDCGVSEADDETEKLAKLDAYLCELKEMQIRDGLHVFGESPRGERLDNLLLALARAPRGNGKGGGASLVRALAMDLGLPGDFDPLDAAMADPWSGKKPEALARVLSDPWRTAGDTVERLELLAIGLISGKSRPSEPWRRAKRVLEQIETTIRPAVESCGDAEMRGLLQGLDGRFVSPGPSGAPTRGRPDVLPTGRNFFSVDTRTLPTPAAWTLGWKSAALLVERFAQDNGDWPRAMVVTAWGTSNMRTGGDDIAQVLALMGAKPTWDGASRRVTGFEILPLDILDRPRVDVTLRISGFFRDAFPGLVDLVASAARDIAALDESADKNPLAAMAREEAGALVGRGLDEKTARDRAAHRVFGSKPGAYGAGLQALVDEKCWRTADDLANAYVAWGGHAYGAGVDGEERRESFEARLRATEAVVQNQDNREHDLLDSDDYYQFEGGATAAVKSLTGRQPATYHMDHSRPESPKARTLSEEIARVVRARVVNPKWIAGVMRHGYKGAFEMVATVDYLFAFQATANCVEDYHFDAVFDAYIEDEAVLGFLKTNNPQGLREMADRLMEAQDRGFWTPRRNSTRAALEGLALSTKGRGGDCPE